MNTREFLNYAQEHSSDHIKFEITKGGHHLCYGEVLDAYFEFLRIPIVGEGFVSIRTLESECGYDLKFELLDDKAYARAVPLDFLLRGREIPEAYQEVWKQACETESEEKK